MDGITVLGILVVLVLMGVIAFAKVASKADDDATAERLAMQNRDWRWPSRSAS